MRKLASIQKVLKLEPIEKADKLELATILGWKCVVRKGEFKEGDLGVYMEVDSLLPDKPEFEFMKERHFRVRTIRLRGQISQGLFMPLSILPIGITISEGMDVSEQLGIVQWVPKIPACLAGEIKGPFPSWMCKTDETRVQNLQEVINRYVRTPCYVTEKIDGASMTCYLKNGEFGVCSRNLDLKETEGNAFWQIVRAYNIEEKMRNYGQNIAIQGEIYGMGLQENRLEMPDKRVAFFSLFFIDTFRYADFFVMNETFKILDLPTVPILEENYLLNNNISEIVMKATRKSVINPKKWAEGIVIRPLKEIMDMQMAQGFGNGRFSFKAINPEYLIDNEI